MKSVLCIVWVALGIVACLRNKDSKDSPDVGWIFMGLMGIGYGPFMFLVIWIADRNRIKDWKPTRIDY